MTITFLLVCFLESELERGQNGGQKIVRGFFPKEHKEVLFLVFFKTSF